MWLKTDFDVAKITAMNRSLPKFIPGAHCFQERLFQDLWLSAFRCHVCERRKRGVQIVPTSLYEEEWVPICKQAGI